MAHLKTRATRQDLEQRLQWKLQLVKRLYEKGYQREDILELFRFIDWLLTLPAAWEQRFTVQLSEYETAMSKPYITQLERYGIEKGLAQGLEQGMQQGLERGLEQGLWEYARYSSLQSFFNCAFSTVSVDKSPCLRLWKASGRSNQHLSNF